MSILPGDLKPPIAETLSSDENTLHKFIQTSYTKSIIATLKFSNVRNPTKVILSTKIISNLQVNVLHKSNLKRIPS